MVTTERISSERVIMKLIYSINYAMWNANKSRGLYFTLTRTFIYFYFFCKQLRTTEAEEQKVHRLRRKTNTVQKSSVKNHDILEGWLSKGKYSKWPISKINLTF